MSTRFASILIFAALVTALVCYLFYQNPEPASVRWASRPDAVLQAPMALIIVVIFFSGVLCSAVFAFIIGVRYQLRDWKLSRDKKMRKNHHALLIAARERLAAGRYPAARELLTKIIDQDPSDIIAQIQLAQSYVGEGAHAQALSVLERARAEHERNTELLFLAAEINRELGNHTAATDNLRLVLEKEPRNAPALEALVESSAALERFDESISFQQQLVRYSQTNQEQLSRLRRLAILELLQVKKQTEGEPQKQREELEALLRRHRDFVPALVELARADREAFQLDNSSKLLQKSYKLEPDVGYLYELSQMWLAVEEPQKAVATVRNLLQSKELSGAARAEASIFFIALLLRLESVEEALAEREKLRQSEPVVDSLATELRVLDALLLRRNAEIDEAFDILFHSAVDTNGCQALEILGEQIGEDYDRLADWCEEVKRRSSNDTVQANQRQLNRELI